LQRHEQVIHDRPVPEKARNCAVYKGPVEIISMTGRSLQKIGEKASG